VSTDVSVGHIAAIFRGEEIGAANHPASRRYVPPKRRLKLNVLHGAISQKMILFITTAVKTSNPTNIIVIYL
jgi:hypothetical protein